MRNHAYLVKSRHSIFYYRLPLPPALHPAGKRSYLKISLKTDSERRALYLADYLSYHLRHFINDHEFANMHYSQMKEVISGALKRLLEAAQMEQAELGPWNAKQKDHFTSLIYIYDRYKPEKSPDDHVAYTNAERNIASQFPELELNGAERKRFTEEWISQYPRHLEDVLGLGIHERGSRPIPLPVMDDGGEKQLRPQIEIPSPTLAEVLAEFAKEKVRLQVWAQSSVEDRMVHYKALEEILGADFPMRKLGKSEAEDVRRIILNLPTNRNKDPRTREKTIREAVNVEGPNKLSPQTVSHYLSSFKNLGRWLTEREYISQNVFASAGIVKRKKMGLSRDAFTVEQIKQMLSAIDTKGYEDTTFKYQYWGPLIGIYTGARIREITQLSLDDIKEENGIPYFDFTDTGEDQQVKNLGSKRPVPIHSALLARGFLEYVNLLRRNKAERLFPELSFHPTDGYSRPLSRWFNNNFLVKQGLKKKELVFHSLRHTIATELRREDVADGICNAVTGHVTPGIAAQVYHKGFRLDQLKRAIEALPY